MPKSAPEVLFLSLSSLLDSQLSPSRSLGVRQLVFKLAFQQPYGCWIIILHENIMRSGTKGNNYQMGALIKQQNDASHLIMVSIDFSKMF
jgi:hypothetical protein